jgi:hypothetical protein
MLRGPRRGVDIYSSTLSLTPAVEGVGGQRHARGALSQGKEPVPIL